MFKNATIHLECLATLKQRCCRCNNRLLLRERDWFRVAKQKCRV